MELDLLVLHHTSTPTGSAPETVSLCNFLSSFAYDGKHIALVDDHTIYYFDHTTIHPTKFKYSHKNFCEQHSEYHLRGDDGKKYVVFTVIAARLLIPNLVIPVIPMVIAPVQDTVTLIYQHGSIATYPISNRTHLVQAHQP